MASLCPTSTAQLLQPFVSVTAHLGTFIDVQPHLELRDIELQSIIETNGPSADVFTVLMCNAKKNERTSPDPLSETDNLRKTEEQI